MFQPLKDGKAAGDFIVFADGFAGAVKEPGRAAFRPTGLAMGPDGALYISDDVHGRIWRVTYHGERRCARSRRRPAPAVAATAPQTSAAGRHSSRRRRRDTGVAAGAARRDKEQVALGDRIFHGEAAGGTCSGCHGSDAKGGPQAPSW